MATLIEKCFACPVRCGANRTERAGFCNVQGLKIAKYYLHPFEEPCISFNKGSGTVFFTGCNLKCVFCQNYELSRAARGRKDGGDAGRQNGGGGTFEKRFAVGRRR